MTDFRVGTTTYTFNNADEIATMVTPSPAQTTTYYFDTSLRNFATTLPDSTCVTNVFNPTGQTKLTYGSRTYPVGYGYDAQGRMKTMTNWSSFVSGTGARVTTWNYDSYRGFLSSKTYDGGAAGPAYTYTMAGRLQTRHWARGTNTTYAYNTLGELFSTSYDDGSTPGITNGYDRRGRQTTITNGTTICTLAYNDAGQILSESYSGGPLNGLSITNGYDSLLRRTNNVVLNGGTILSTITNNFDAASRLQTISDGTNYGTYSYLANSPLVSQITFKQNGTTRMTTTKAYDNLNRLTSIASSNATPARLDFHGYGYNSANQRTSVTNTDGTFWVYQYDSLGQVTSGKKYWSDGNIVAGQQFGYAFDDIGNRQTTQAGGSEFGADQRWANYTANNLNQYTSRTVPNAADVIGSSTNTSTVTINDKRTYRHSDYYRTELPIDNSSGPAYQSVTNLAVLNKGSNPDIITNTTGNIYLPQSPESFTYDADGNVTQDGRWKYSWDGENRLIALTNNSNVPDSAKMTLNFAYDHQGRRISKTVSNYNAGAYHSALQNTFVYDGWNIVDELNGTNNAVIRSYIWGLDLSGSMQGAGGVGGLLTISSPGSSQFLCFDGNGNIATTIDTTSAAISGQYEYGSFSEAIKATGSIATASLFRWSTKYRDDETDLIYYGYRYYAPSIGRWLSQDPIAEAGGRNLYGFAGNNPISQFDPHGDIGLDTALDLLVLGVDLYTGQGSATIALDIAALAIPLPVGVNPRIVETITWLINGEKKTYQLVKSARLEEVAIDGPRILIKDFASRPQKATIALEYRGRLLNQAGNDWSKHFKFFAGSEDKAQAATLNHRPSQFAPGIGDEFVRKIIDEALKKHRADFSQTFYSQLNGYVYDAGIPFGNNAFRTTIGYADGQCTTRIELKVGKDGSVHAFPTLEPATPKGSVVTPRTEGE